MHLPFLNHGPVKKEEKEDKDEKGDGDNEAKVKIESPLPDDSSAPKLYYTQPFADAAADVVVNKNLDFIPPSHSHSRDYLISTNDCFPVVVGEAESAGSTIEDKRVKSMLGVLRVLNVYDHAIGMISGTHMCEMRFNIPCHK